VDRPRRSTASANRAKNQDQAREAAYRFLSFRVRSRQELSEKLLRKGFEPQTVERTLEQLTRLGYLDDLRFAKDWVRSRMTRKGYGRELLRQELRAKGISSELIEEAFGQEEVDEAEAARRALEKRFPELRGGATRARQIAFQYLRRRGFPSDVILSVLKEREALGS